MITWHYITSEIYNTASDDQKTNDKLFFLSDTGEIYRGKQNFTESVIMYSDIPTVKAVGKLYINSNTLEGIVWNGTSWISVIKPIATTLDASNTTKPVSGKAVADYVAERINDVTGSNGIMSNVTYTAETNSINVIMADGSSESIPMTNVAADLVYDTTTGKLQVKNASGTTIGSGINLDLERFVSAASYDHETRKITLSFNAGDPLTIDVGDLVDTYTVGNTSSVMLTMTNNNIIATVQISKESDNMLSGKSDGLYVAPTDISGKMDLVDGATAGNIAVFGQDGKVIDNGYSYGSDTINANPNSNTLATEAAVAAIRTALIADINDRMYKVQAGKGDEIILATPDGNVTTSGVKIGGGDLSAIPNAATIATEKAVEKYVSNYAVAKTNIVVSSTFAAQTTAGVSDTKVASEKAVFDSMSWKTTV